MAIVLVVELKQDKDVIRQPADEKSSDERRHDFEGFGGFGHSVGPKFEDDDGVADDDDDKRDNKPSKEATQRYNLVTVLV